MNTQTILEKYIQLCHQNLMESDRAIQLLKKRGIYEKYILTNFNIGISGIDIPGLTAGNRELIQKFNQTGLVKNQKETYTGSFTLPVLDENRALVNIVFFNPHPNCKTPLNFLNPEGIFNAPYLKNVKEIIFVQNPLDALTFIEKGMAPTTFFIGEDQKYLEFCSQYGITKTTFTFDGKAKLYYLLTANGISCRRISLEPANFRSPQGEIYLSRTFQTPETDQKDNSDRISEIENGFIFRFNHLSYRVIGNFTGYSVHLKANIKAFTNNEVFVDSIDLYKNRERQNFVYNLMEKFQLRDQIQLEQDLNQIIEVIEKHKEKQANENKKTKPRLTDFQKDIGTKFLTNANLIQELEDDITNLGYVRERKNKLLMYLIMTSRLLNHPLHAIIISRSGAGKSQLVDIVETLCPPEELESVSDLSAQALYYYGQDDLMNKFIVVGEKEGSKGAEYPLRELISRKSITKAIPMKDQITGQIKTVSIKVNGPIALVETTTNGEINPENLNRCFIIGIDETEEQTRLIHQSQREKYTFQNHLIKKKLNKIREKHIYAQRLLKKIHVFNPFAPLLTFPSAKLKSRRDNEKLLRLIIVICFLHQYQRKLKKHTLDNGETIEYIECTIEDYRIAYELLSDGVLDSTLDDIPRPARKLVEQIKKYLEQRSQKDEIAPEKIIFTRKDIREYTSWSFAQIRNNFRILKDYEYVQTVKSKNGAADQYRLSADYRDVDFLTTILTPGQLEEKIKERIKKLKNRSTV